MDNGTLIMSGLNQIRIIESIETITQLYKDKIIPKIINDYDEDNVSHKVVKTILSHMTILMSGMEKRLFFKINLNFKIEDACNISIFLS